MLRAIGGGKGGAGRARIRGRARAAFSLVAPPTPAAFSPTTLAYYGQRQQRRPLSSTSSPAGPAAPGGMMISVENQRRILSRCDQLQQWLEPLNQRLRGPLEKCSDKAPLLPFVFLLGNHSSGKSSFINYVLGRNVQTAGVAPTDDAFTIIAPGPSDIDQDGPALIGDPDMGFSGLRHFGPDLIHHTQLKIRSGIAAQDLMLVDSPGMIDSPVTSQTTQRVAGEAMGTLRGSRQRHMDRGYDFQGVCKWFADRADVILLFFDPDKPGTTGETLSILTESLAGMDHKLYIVLNKADQFRKIHDFARAYGSLTWNLSKVIPRKDLPRIYTMCLPVQYQRRGDHLSLKQRQEDEGEASSLGQGLLDLERSRDEVVGEVLKAPKRRIDNVITRLADSLHLVQMHARVLEALRADFARELWTFRAGAAGLATAGAGLVAGGAYLGLALEPLLAFAALYAAGSGGFLFYNSRVLKEHEAALASPEGLRRVFERLYARQVLEGDEFVTSLWKRTYPSLHMVVDTQQGGLARLPRATGAELQELERILEEDLPALRRLAAPVQWTYKQQQGQAGGGSGAPRPIGGVARSFANMIGTGGTGAASSSSSASAPGPDSLGGQVSSHQDEQQERRAVEGRGTAYRTMAAEGIMPGRPSSYTSWKVE